MKLKRLLSLTGLILATLTTFGQTHFADHIQENQHYLDSLSQNWRGNNSPGLLIAITENSELLYRSATGLADVDGKIKITANTAFSLASLTKQFVAYSILQLEENGKLLLDADIRTYLPEMQYEGITVRHLLNHSSGIPEYWGIWSLSSFESDNLNDIYTLLKAQTTTKSQPGEKYEYTNSNYILLSLIIENITGKPISSYMRKNIFDPFGMKNTYFLTEMNQTKENQAKNYMFDGENYTLLSQPISDIVGDGGLFSSLEDLLIWNQKLYDHSNISKNRKQVGILNSGQSSIYAAGLQRYENKGLLSYEHGGGSQGVSTYFAQFPAYKISIIVLANTDAINANAIFESIKSMVFSKETQETPNQTINEWNNFDQNTLHSFEGKYYGFSNEGGTTFTIKLGTNDTLNGNSFGRASRKYLQSDASEFSAVDVPDIRLVFDANHLSIFYQHYTIGSFWKMSNANQIDPSALLGDYTSPTINNANWNVSKSEESLIVTNPRNKSFPLVHLEGNLFYIEEMNLLMHFSQAINNNHLTLIHEGAGEIILSKK